MPRKGKRYLEMQKKVKGIEFVPEQAISMVKQVSNRNFVETVESAIALNIRPKAKGERVRGTVMLPRGLGKSVRVLVFAAGDQAEEAQKAGADHVGGEDLVAKVQGGWLDFDAVVATPELMRSVAKLGRLLGPKGLMPSPKVGTVTDSPARVVEELKKGKIEYRNDATGVIHAPIGKVSFDDSALLENFHALLAAVNNDKPPTVKGRYIKTIFLSSTMGPGVRVKWSE